jgi:hypothetical protein
MGEGGAQPWTEFGAALGRFLTEMEPEDQVLLQVTDVAEVEGKTTPYAQFWLTADDEVHAELSSAKVLRAPYKLVRGGVAALHAAGWRRPTRSCVNFAREAARDECDALGAAVAEALEQVYGLAHPQLLEVQTYGTATERAAELGLVSAEEPTEEELEVAEVVMSGIEPVGCRSELSDALGRALPVIVEQEVEQDDDGDWVVPHARGPVWVRAEAGAPMIRIFARVVGGVRSRRQAAVEASILSRDYSFCSWVLIEDAIYQYVVLPAQPFVPAHLDAALTQFVETLDRVHDDLALRTGGR